MGDSTTAIVWIHKAHKHAPIDHPQLTLAKTILQRQRLDLLIDNTQVLYSTWFPGTDNFITNILSIDWHLDDNDILNLLTNIFPTQLHPYLWLSQVPSVIDSFLWSVIHSLPNTTQMWTKPNPSAFTLGINVVIYYDQSALKATSF